MYTHLHYEDVQSMSSLPEKLKEALSSDRLVYVFGSGISSALSGCSSSWNQLIRDGIDHISDIALAYELKHELSKNSSAESLVEIIGRVIKATQLENTYTVWMKSSIERMSVVNTALADTLSLARIPNDLITTTNFDLLLEEATGLSSLDYQQPDAIFQMIDAGKADCVFHLHGRYDPSNHIDSIIASKERYNRIYNDEAVQFIQNLIGTRTLIFVGCGQTTDDINISRFISFAADKIHLDVPCFFLKRESEGKNGLPSNFTVVDYGVEYGDLPNFLYDMMVFRAEVFLCRNPIVGRTCRTHERSSSLSQYHYADDEVCFVGRKDEIQSLLDFINLPDKFLWWAITGQAGSGKSRLALELMKQCSMYSFFINDRATMDEISSFEPFCDTLIVIDYVQGRESFTADAIRIL